MLCVGLLCGVYCDNIDLLLVEAKIVILPIIVHTLLTFWIARKLGAVFRRLRASMPQPGVLS